MKRRRVPVLAGVAIAVALGTALVTFGVGRSRGQAAADIPEAPAFSAEQLNAAPERDWITNGGNLKNNRYSALDNVNKSNVGQLRSAWQTHLEGSGGTRPYSQEATPLVYDGVMYI